MRSTPLSLAIALMVAAVPAMAGAPVVSNAAQAYFAGYDFNYRIADAEDMGIGQVFDDGARTYVQFRDEVTPQSATVPTVWVEGAKGELVLARIEARRPYLVIDGVFQRIVFKLPPAKMEGKGKAKAKTPVVEKISEVHFTGTRTRKVGAFASGSPDDSAPLASVPTVPAASAGKAVPAPMAVVTRFPVSATLMNVPFNQNAVSPSASVLDQMRQQVARAGVGAYYIVRGKPSVAGDEAIANTRSLALRSALVSYGVPGDHIRIQKDSAVKPGRVAGNFLSEIVASPQPLATDARLASNEWEFDPSVTPTFLSGMNAWSERVGWHAVWNLPADYPVSLKTSFTGSFKEVVSSAADALSRSIRSPIDVKFYDGNKVVTFSAPGATK